MYSESEKNKEKRWHDSRSHEKVAGCRLGTDSGPRAQQHRTPNCRLAEGSRHRTTVPPFFIDVSFSRSPASFSLEQLLRRTMSLAHTRSFVLSLSRSVSRCRLHVHFLSSLFTFVLVLLSSRVSPLYSRLFFLFCSFLSLFERNIYIYKRSIQKRVVVCLRRDRDSRSSLSCEVTRYSLCLFLALRAISSEPTSRGPAAEPVRKPVTGTTRHTKAISRLAGRPRLDQSQCVFGRQVVPRSRRHERLLHRKKLVPGSFDDITDFKDKKFISIILSLVTKSIDLSY